MKEHNKIINKICDSVPSLQKYQTEISKEIVNHLLKN